MKRDQLHKWMSRAIEQGSLYLDALGEVAHNLSDHSAFHSIIDVASDEVINLQECMAEFLGLDEDPVWLDEESDVCPFPVDDDDE